MIQAAVIGLGKIGLMYDVFSPKNRPATHAIGYHLHPEIHLQAAVGVRQAQADHLAEHVPEAQFYLDVHTMLEQNKLDIISVCTPSHVRLDLLRTLLEQSDAPVIFCEKPVARSIAEAQHIQRLLSHHPERTLVPNLSRRWNKGMADVQQAIKQQTYGKLTKIHLRYTRGIYNSGAHLFDLLRFFAGDIAEVQVIDKIPSSMDLQEDWTYSFLFRMSDGDVTGYAEAFDDQQEYYIFELDLFFERGKIELHQGGDTIHYYGVEDHPMMPGLSLLRSERSEYAVMNRSNNMANAIQHLVEVLKGSAQPICKVEDAIYPLYVAEALIRSYQSKQREMVVCL